GDGFALGRVTAIGASASDLHNRGRSVVALTFASGLKLIYKPKDVGLEAAYFDLLAWFNAQGPPLPFRVVSVLPGAGYGWVEFVEHVPCADPSEVARYYRRAGMLLALVYALAGNDCHYENIVSHGEQPVLVDLETILCPQAAP